MARSEDELIDGNKTMYNLSKEQKDKRSIFRNFYCKTRKKIVPVS